jgi:copper(I)-binding protein
MNAMLKGSVLFCSAVALGVLAAAAQQPGAPASPATNALGPRIKFEKTLHDFGRVSSGEPVKYTYVFTNTGDATLVVTNVQPQCGCTTAGQWSREVPPGGTGTIPIQFNTAAYNSEVFKQITVICNDKTQPVQALQLKGTVFKALSINPQMAYMNVPADADTAAVTLTITNNTEQPLMLWAAECNNKALSAELKTNAPGKGYQLVVSVVPPMTPPGVAGLVTMKTSWTNQPVVNVSVYASKQAAVAVIPPHIMLPAGGLSTRQTSSVTIQNHSANPISLTNASVNAPGVEVQVKETQPGRIFIALASFPEGFEFPAGRPLELTVQTSNPKCPLIKVPITQYPRPYIAQPAPRPAASPMVQPPAPLKPVKTTALEMPPPVPDVPSVR